MSSFRHIGLVLGSHGEFNRGCARGIAAWSRANARWIFHAIDLLPAAVPQLAAQRPDGVIGVLVDEALGAAVCGIGVPVVNVAKLHNRMDLPRVDHDDHAIGVLAARHLIDRGFRAFAYIGLPLLPYSLERERGFVETVRNAGHAVSVTYMVEHREAMRNASGWPEDESRLAEWVAGLPWPVGIMICSDWHGWKIAELCRHRGIRVPEEAALIGVDNDEPWCSLSHPPLSSVVTNAERIGYEAAAVLQRLLDGAPPASILPRELPPAAVVTRQSSDTVAIDDADVAAAMRFVRDHAHEAIGVDDVLDAVAVSRRYLERRFRRLVGRSIGAEIIRQHVDRAKDLLVRTELAMPQIARVSGFTNAKRFSETFRRVAGCAPTDYRGRFRSRQ